VFVFVCLFFVLHFCFLSKKKHSNTNTQGKRSER
jgi:hypothetical protein